MTLSEDILVYARGLGFDSAGIVAVGPTRYAGAFANWLTAGYHGEMRYLAARAAVRTDPARLAPDARSMIVLLANYNPGPTPVEWGDPSRGRFARYAWSADYHEVIKPRLHELDTFLRAHTGRETPGKVCVDTAPLLERDFAMQSGLGFIGRNTCLITPGLGSWTFLAALLVPEQLDKVRTTDDKKESVSRRASPALSRAEGFVGCGHCTRCLDACPTGAFRAPYVLDARRCISYLTIELRGPIPPNMRLLMGNWVFGCDVCQEVCPYNHFAPPATWSALVPDVERAAPSLLELMVLNEKGFRAKYLGTAVMRTKRRGLVRNACVAAANWGGQAAVPPIVDLIRDPEVLVRGHAAWALGRIGDRYALRALEDAATSEPDTWVRDEILAARSMA